MRFTPPKNVISTVRTTNPRHLNRYARPIRVTSNGAHDQSASLQSVRTTDPRRLKSHARPIRVASNRAHDQFASPQPTRCHAGWSSNHPLRFETPAALQISSPGAGEHPYPRVGALWAVSIPCRTAPIRIRPRVWPKRTRRFGPRQSSAFALVGAAMRTEELPPPTRIAAARLGPATQNRA